MVGIILLVALSVGVIGLVGYLTHDPVGYYDGRWGDE